MPARVSIVESKGQIKARLLFALQKQVTKILKRAAPTIETKARVVLARTISQSPVIKSLLGGKLKVDFGLTDSMAESATNEIISQISKNLNVEFTLSRDKKNIASLLLTIPPISSALATQISQGSYISQGMYGGGEVSWLEWLLTKGTTVVLEDFEVIQTDDYDERSRSGGGFMIKTGAGFRIEPEFAGNEGDNFITRAVSMATNEIQALVKKELIGAI